MEASHSSSYRGRITGITEEQWGQDKGKVRIEVEQFGDKPPKPKKGEGALSPSAPSRSHYVSKEVAGQLTIGDQVICETSISKVKALKRKGNPGPKHEGY
jgi:hypothetical protein